MSAQSREERLQDSERSWGAIRRRFEELERAATVAPDSGDLAAVWHQRAIELAAAPDRDREAGEALKHLVVRLGADRYAVALTAVREILRVGRVTPLSTAPPVVHGVINVRGVVVAVLDPRVFFGIEAVAVGEAARIVIAEGGGMVVGLLVEAVEEIVDLAVDAIKPPLPAAKGIAEDYVAGIATPGDRMVVLIDLEKVLRNPRIVVDEVV